MTQMARQTMLSEIYRLTVAIDRSVVNPARDHCELQDLEITSKVRRGLQPALRLERPVYAHSLNRVHYGIFDFAARPFTGLGGDSAGNLIEIDDQREGIFVCRNGIQVLSQIWDDGSDDCR
jgi:hypothetical protein